MKTSWLGLGLFALYVAAYAAFLWLNAFHPDWMRRPAVAGMNVAVAYGFALVGAAAVFALLYALVGGEPSGTRAQEEK